ncbi:MAG: hypothetical protein LBI42_10940 [Chitinispirillales bacterium]|jgi:hypothetical protein|nr:hypothetical protein [Chitinispirillales bacterium]
MKKLLCAAVMVACVSFTAVRADISSNALGLRGILGDGYGGELNYQRAMDLYGAKRLEVGASWFADDFAFNVVAAAAPQWHWNISSAFARGGFNWYTGPAVAMGLYGLKEQKAGGEVTVKGKNEMYLGVGAQLGVEYDFKTLGVPLNLSLDTRPIIDFFHLKGMGVGDILYGSLSLRYTF